MHQVDDVGDRHQDHPGAVVGAAPFGSFSRFRFLAELGGALVVGFAFGYIVIIGLGHNFLPIDIFAVSVLHLLSGTEKRKKGASPLSRDGWRLCQYSLLRMYLY